MNTLEQERLHLSSLQRKLLNGSMSLDYVAVVRLKDEIHDSMKKIKALVKKERLEQERDVK